MEQQEVLELAEELGEIEEMLSDLSNVEKKLQKREQEKWDKIASWAKKASHSTIKEVLQVCEDPRRYDALVHVLDKVILPAEMLSILAELD